MAIAVTDRWRSVINMLIQLLYTIKKVSQMSILVTVLHLAGPCYD